MTETLSYVYAILRHDAAPPSEVKGIAGAEVRKVAAGELAALVSTVSAEEFGEQGLREHLEDLRWLERTVWEHNSVVDAAAAVATVAPLALATVYYDDDRVRAALQERAEEFLGVLDLITGRTEWGVKAYAELSAPEGAEDSGEDAQAESPGRAYLGKLRKRKEGRARAEGEAVERAGEVHEALAAIADAVRVPPPQNKDLAGYQGMMVLNGAYLVDDARTEEFRAAVDEAVRDSSLRVELTGPWAPYSFAVVDVEERR